MFAIPGIQACMMVITSRRNKHCTCAVTLGKFEAQQIAVETHDLTRSETFR